MQSEKRKSYSVRIAVLGGGHAGRGLAGYLALHGFDVSLYNRTLNNVRGIIERGGLDVYGVINGFAPIRIVSDNMEETIRNRDILIVTVPAQAHSFFAYRMSPHLEENQLVLLMPGRTGGALEFAQIAGVCPDGDYALLGEAQTFSFVSRTTGSSSVLISKIKNRVQVSAFPATRNQEYLSRLKVLPISLVRANTVLETGLNNVGAMLHPAPTILCAGLLESKHGGYNHYHDAISESVGQLIERMDTERVKVGKHFSRNPMTLLDWLQDAYGAEGESLCECLRSIDAYDGVGSPDTLQHRYVLEDVPTGLVPISRLGKLCGVDTPAIDAVINIACHLYDCDFWHTGRNLISMGLLGMSLLDVVEYVQNGKRPIEVASLQEGWDLYEIEVDDI
ncbi:MAG: NAD/NADP octopine/nopaline dehydrogenase family protein [Candidatus Thorarchaeota archaeon]|nr:MAG: NAD/NADP octopine/nopaline dehydrogenase family protein [Candidatus Thorarchaeota archaeon]